MAVALSHNSPCGSAPAIAPGAQPVEASVHRCYGPPGIVRTESIAKPVPTEHDVLVRVRAASVNPLDWHTVRGEPYLMRLASGWGTPAYARLGVDFAGTVEAVGAQVTRFKPGDRVFGGADGAFAQYIVLGENGSLELAPANLSFEQAAAVPVAGLTALQAVRDHGKLRPGQKVLINGAGGGVGTFAVQIAKALGGEVTATTSTGNLALVRSIGADHVIDYTREDFTRGTQRYDLIIDCGGGHSNLQSRRALTPVGTYVGVGEANMGKWLEPVGLFVSPLLMSRLVKQRFIAFIARLDRADLATLRDLIQAGRVRPVIDRRYSLEQVGEALSYLETGHARGKVVISVE